MGCQPGPCPAVQVHANPFAACVVYSIQSGCGRMVGGGAETPSGVLAWECTRVAGYCWCCWSGRVWLAVAHILGQQRASRELQLSYLARRLCSTSAGLVCCMQSGCSHCHMRVLAVIEVYCELYCEKQGRVERVRRCGCHSNILNVSSVVRQLAAGGTTTHWAGWHRCKIALVFIMCTEQSCFMELQPAFWS